MKLGINIAYDLDSIKVTSGYYASEATGGKLVNDN